MTFTLGAISTGTLRLEDLLPAFLSALDDLREDATFEPGADAPEAVAAYGRLDDELGAMERRMSRPGYYASFEVAGDLDRLTELLEERCPIGVYFGTHEGDGADFGFWPDPEFLARPEDYGTDECPVIRVADLSEVDDSFRGTVLHVNDHGNVTVYSAEPEAELVELWSCA